MRALGSEYLRSCFLKNPITKNITNCHFPAHPILNSFSRKISGIDPWVSRINWCKGQWCGLTYMVVRLSDISTKKGKKITEIKYRELTELENDIFLVFGYWVFLKKLFFCFFPMKISLAFIWGIVYFCTRDWFFRILKKTSFQH